jgi:hypothetical protein
MISKQLQAAEAYIKCLRTGEASATRYAATFLAPDIESQDGPKTLRGKDAVTASITGRSPWLLVYYRGTWSFAEDGNRVRARGEFPAIAGAFEWMQIDFTFDAQGQIQRIDTTRAAMPTEVVCDTIPGFVQALVNGALQNATPMVAVYVDETGQPKASMRGGVQVYSDTQLCLWLRDGEGGLSRALTKNSKLALLYRDATSRTTLMFEGRGSITHDVEVRNRIYEMTPEVEQLHDPARRGAALIIDITKLTGNSILRGPLRMERKLDQ